MDRPAIETDGLRRVLAPAQIEWRDAAAGGDTPYGFSGHAAVFSTWTTLYEGRYFVWREQLAPGAFTNILASNPDVHLNLGHDMNRSVARTGISGVGGLGLSEDPYGLAVDAMLDPNDPDVIAMAAKLRLGVMDQMSFAFQIGNEDVAMYTDAQGRDVEDHTINEVSNLLDVCVCARGAYPTTDASLRQLATSREAELAALRNTPITRPSSGRSALIRARHAAHLLHRRSVS